MQTQDSPSSEAIPFEFSGTASQYFGIWIVNILLTIITLGIYLPWAKVRTHRYFYSNTLLNDAPFDYLASPIAILKGWAVAFIVIIIYNIVTGMFPIAALITLPLIFIATPWVLVRAFRFRLRNTAYHNIHFGFRNAYKEAAMAFVVWPLLAMLTLGLLYPRFIFEANRFIINNSGYGTTRFQFHGSAKDFYKIYSKASLIILVLLLLLLALMYPKIQDSIEFFKAKATAEQTPADIHAPIEISQTEELPSDISADNISDESLTDESPIDELPMDELPMDEMLVDNLPAEGQAIDEISDEEFMKQFPPEPSVPDQLPEAGSAEEPSQEILAEGENTTEETLTETAALPEEDYEEEVTEEMTAPEEVPAPVSDAPPMSKEDTMKMAAIGTMVFFAVLVIYMVLFVYISARTTNLVYNQTEIAGHRFHSSVRVRDLAWLYLSNLLAISLSFGLLIPWTKVRMARYRASKLVLLANGNLETFMQAEEDKINALGEEIGDAFDIDFAL